MLSFSGKKSIGSTVTADSSWLDTVLGQTRQGVFTADFEEKNNTSLELGDGDNMTLDCRVFLKQEKTVSNNESPAEWWESFQISWLRHTVHTSPDLLTVGNITYTGDTRISSSFSYPNNWRLVIKDVTSLDTGLYVCQISTHPPKELHTTVLVRGKTPLLLS